MLVSGWSLVSAAAVGWLVHLLWRPPLLARLAARPDPPRPWLPGPLRPRSDALPGRTRALLGVGVAVVGFTWTEPLGWYVAMPLAAVAGAVVAVGLGLLEPSSSAARRRQLVAELPQALRLVAAGLSAGLPLRGAVRVVSGSLGGPVSQELQGVLAQIEIGVSEEDAWASLRDHPVLGTLARDLTRAVESGTAIHGVLLHRAAEIQSDHRAAVEVRAKAVGVRTVLPLSLCFLPAFLMLGIVPVVAGLVAPLFQP